MDFAFQFYCCQPEPEKGLSFALAAAFAGSLFGPVPSDPFDTVWLGVTRSPQGRKAAFDPHYRVSRGIVIDPVTEQPVNVFLCDDPFWWAEFIAFLTTTEANCSSGCTLKMFP